MVALAALAEINISAGMIRLLFGMIILDYLVAGFLSRDRQVTLFNIIYNEKY